MIDSDLAWVNGKSGINSGLLDPKGRFTVVRKDQNLSALYHGDGVCVLITVCVFFLLALAKSLLI